MKSKNKTTGKYILKSIDTIMAIQILTTSKLPTDFGHFNIITFAIDETQQMPHIAMVHEDIDLSSDILLRMHSECLTGDIFSSKRCDCGPQLNKAMELIGREKGILLYLRQEGRGIGLINKMKAYNAQDEGMDTHQANLHLGFEADARNYDVALRMLHLLKVKNVRLLTNNPEKIAAFNKSSINLVSRIPLIMKSNEVNKSYLETKSEKFGHLLNQ